MSHSSATKITTIGSQADTTTTHGWTVTSYVHGTSLASVTAAGANPWTGTTGAQVCKRYENGVLTQTPLWPWPMNDRILAATGYAGAYNMATGCVGCTWSGQARVHVSPPMSRLRSRTCSGRSRRPAARQIDQIVRPLSVYGRLFNGRNRCSTGKYTGSTVPISLTRQTNQVAAALTLGMTAGQGLHDPIDETLVVEPRVDSAEGGIPEFVSIGQEHFDQTALPAVRSPHMAPPVRPVPPQAAPRELRSHATGDIAWLPRCDRAARGNTGRAQFNSHRKVVRERIHKGRGGEKPAPQSPNHPIDAWSPAFPYDAVAMMSTLDPVTTGRQPACHLIEPVHKRRHEAVLFRSTRHASAH